MVIVLIYNFYFFKILVFNYPKNNLYSYNINK